MAKKSLTSMSLDRDVIQDLHWDTITKKIEVYHTINLQPERNIRWVSRKPYLPGDPGYTDMLDKYEDFLIPGYNGPITEFLYQEFEDTSQPYEIAVKFPESGDYYALSGQPHAIGVDADGHDPAGTPVGSKTSGEAL